MTPLVLAQAGALGAGGPDLMPSVWRMLVALAIVLALLGALAWVAKRGLLGRRRTALLGVESALALGDRRQLLIVTVEGRRLLLGLAPNHVSLVTELAPPPFERAIAAATHQDVRP